MVKIKETYSFDLKKNTMF